MTHRSTEYKEGYGMGLRRAEAIIFSELGKVFVESDRMDVPAYYLHEGIRRANQRMDAEAKVYFRQNDNAKRKKGAL